MRGRYIGATLAVAVTFALLAHEPGPVGADSHTSIEGQVTGGTPGAQLPESIEVSLTIIEGDTFIAELIEATGPDGRFTFSDIPTGSGLTYLVSIAYQDGFYQVEAFPEESDPVSLVIYESTSDEELLSVVDDTIMLTPSEEGFGEMVVRQVVRINNDQLLTFIPSLGEDGATDMSFLRFALPTGYQELIVRTDLLGGQSIPFGDGVAITAAVPPGAHAVVLTYLAPYEDDSLVLEPVYPCGAGVVRVLIQEGLGTAIGSALDEMEPVTVGANQFRVYEATDIGRGDMLTVGLTNLPQASWINRTWDSFESQWQLTLIIPGLSAIFLLALLAYAWRLRRVKLESADPAAVIRNIQRQPAQLSLLESIAKLDEKARRGEISDEEYRARRDELKRALLR